MDNKATGTENPENTGNPNITELKEVLVRFVSKSAPPVADAPFAVPVTLARYGLSEIVNELLQQKPPVPYDFLIEGEFLRTDLARYLREKNVSGESGLVLEYVRSLPAPTSLPSQPHPDWISALDARAVGYVVTGCYDGRIRVVEQTGKNGNEQGAVASGSGHKAPVKAVRWLKRFADTELALDYTKATKSSDFGSLLVSASKDRTVRVWRYAAKGNKLSPVAVGKGHTEAVEALAVSEAGNMFATGGWDKKILVWAAPDSDEAEGQSATKKRKTADSKEDVKGVQDLTPRLTLEGHSGAVSALSWPASIALYSGSWDHSIRLWDPKTGKQVQMWNGNKVITSLAFSLNANLLASGHNDNVIRLWDPRTQDVEVAKGLLRSHKGWITDVAWCPESAHLLASTSHDNTVKLWDIRAKIPLHTVTAHTDKALCVDWYGKSRIISGGADCKLQVQHVPSRD